MQNLINIANKGRVGNCPKCKNEDTDYEYVIHNNGRAGLFAWCNSCKDEVHVRCNNVPANRKQISMAEALDNEKRKRELAI